MVTSEVFVGLPMVKADKPDEYVNLEVLKALVNEPSNGSIVKAPVVLIFKAPSSPNDKLLSRMTTSLEELVTLEPDLEPTVT